MELSASPLLPNLAAHNLGRSTTNRLATSKATALQARLAELELNASSAAAVRQKQREHVSRVADTSMEYSRSAAGAEEQLKHFAASVADVAEAVASCKRENESRAVSLQRVIEARFAALEEQISKESKARAAVTKEEDHRLSLVETKQLELLRESERVGQQTATAAKGVVPTLERDTHTLVERAHRRQATKAPAEILTPRLGSPNTLPTPEDGSGSTEELQVKAGLRSAEGMLQKLRAEREQETARLLDELYRDVNELKGVVTGMRQHREKAAARDVEPIWGTIDALRLASSTARRQRDLKLDTASERMTGAITGVHAQQSDTLKELDREQDQRMTKVEAGIWELEKQATLEAKERAAEAEEIARGLRATGAERQETEETVSAAVEQLHTRLQQAVARR
eukprot:TRINITY_DN16600_c0_g1_i1.p1 TRINITY_DN16600_c0_g1~~TRINITY_DN16600_c0_g1_i1.p1  ORF type:complete len:407 (+),score=84.97 TRINITY_DN16600_c0_g1_i1:25-1221(+)